MDDRDRIVIVSSGFGVWEGGRCVAAARWGDVERVAVSRQTPSPALVALHVTLRDGAQVQLHAEVPGWNQFLAAASAALPGMVQGESARTALRDVPRTGELVLFARTGRSPRPGRER